MPRVAVHPGVACKRWIETAAIRWIAAGAAVLLLCGAVLGSKAMGKAEALFRARMIASLEAQFHCPVELDTLHISLIRGLEVNGTGLRILAIGGKQRTGGSGPPMLSVRSLQFHTGWSDLFFEPRSAITAYAQGLVLDVPPKDDRTPIQQGDPSKRGQPRNSFFLNHLVATDSKLLLETGKPHKPAVEFDIRRLTLADLGRDRPFAFEVTLINPKPIGDIHATGHFGPWLTFTPHDTPLDGVYDFSNADLATIKGLNGTLASTGHFSGVLNRIAVDGHTDTPDFRMDISRRDVPLRVDFHAVVDGTTGDVTIEHATAQFLHSSVLASGVVTRTPGIPGLAWDMDLNMPEGRAEDVLEVLAKTNPPLMNAAMTLKGHLKVPLGKEKLLRKLQVTGSATIHDATWSSPTVQESIDSLSERAQNRSRELKVTKQQGGRPDLVTSTLAGHFIIANAVISVTGLSYDMAGVSMRGGGEYELEGPRMEFHGMARTSAEASQMVTGWKSVLLKPVDPFLKKRGAGMELPVKFGGEKKAPRFQLDLPDRRQDHAAAAPAPVPSSTVSK